MPNDTYNSSSGQRTEYVYDPTTGKWKPVTYSSPSSSSGSASGGTTAPAKAPAKAPAASPKPPNVVNSANSQVNSQAIADKEFIEIEYNTLTGELMLAVNPTTIKIKVGQTIEIKGVGKYLSGLYYVSSIKRKIDNSSGYTQTLTVIKTGFGSSLKKIEPPAAPPPRKEPVPKAPPTPALKVGDKVKIVGANAVYSNADDGVKVPEWVKKKVLTVDAISSDGTRVRLMPIWSWTYVKFIQKV